MAAPVRHGDLPEEVSEIRRELARFLDSDDGRGGKVGDSKHGIYAFFDYDEEPIYTGQTYESLRSRIGRHLTNQRTDAVAMNVLDPFEVAFVEVWPLDEIVAATPELVPKELLNRAEFTVYSELLAGSTFGYVLNEKPIAKTQTIQLPPSFRSRIVPGEIFARRSHPDVRIARRAATIAQLARVVSERKVSKGLRRTLLVQARRLESLVGKRCVDLKVDVDPVSDQR